VLADRWKDEIVEVFIASPHANLVGALGLDVAGLLALVASLLATGGALLGALAGEMSGAAAVVALLAVNAVACRRLVTVRRAYEIKTGTLTRQMADTSAGVACLLVESTGTAALAVAGVLESTTTSGTTVRALGAVAGDVANLAALEKGVSKRDIWVMM